MNLLFLRVTETIARGQPCILVTDMSVCLTCTINERQSEGGRSMAEGQPNIGSGSEKGCKRAGHREESKTEGKRKLLFMAG